MKEVIFRKMMVSDIPEVVRIENESFSTPWSEASFFHEINNPQSICRVALSDNSLVGYICASCIHDEGHILTLAVRPGWRRRGLGKTLARLILKDLRLLGCRQILLEVRASNIAARRLYESIGFRMVGLRKGYYPYPREDALVMRLELNGVCV